jgi:hypothetical protein
MPGWMGCGVVIPLLGWVGVDEPDDVVGAGSSVVSTQYDFWTSKLVQSGARMGFCKALALRWHRQRRSKQVAPFERG